MPEKYKNLFFNLFRKKNEITVKRCSKRIIKLPFNFFNAINELY